MFCPKCGMKALDGATFCQKCGAKLTVSDAAQQAATAMPVQQTQPETQNAPSDAPKKKKFGKLTIILSAVVLVTVLIIIVASFGKGDGIPQTQGNVTLTTSSGTETYTNDTVGISFKYPSEWVILDSDNEFEVVEMIDSQNNANSIASFKVFSILDQDPLGVFTKDEASVREAVNEFGTFLKLENTLIGDVPAKGLMYQNTGLKGNDIVTNFWYLIGNDVYQITCSYSESKADIYEPIFNAIMDSYKITATNAAEENGTANAIEFPLATSTDAMNIFAEWAAKHPLVGDYHLDLISDDDVDDENNKIFLFTLETGGIGTFNMSIRKSDGYMEYISNFDTVSMDEWYQTWSADEPDNGGENVASDLSYEGVPLINLLGDKPEELNKIFGTPTGGTLVNGELLYGATEYYTYDGIGFMLGDQGTVVNITVGADAVEVNGTTLNQNHAGIVNLLGTPWNEEQLPEDEAGEGLGGYYVMEYNVYDGGVITTTTIELPDVNSIANRVVISQNIDESSGEEYQQSSNDIAAPNAPPAQMDASLYGRWVADNGNRIELFNDGTGISNLSLWDYIPGSTIWTMGSERGIEWQAENGRLILAVRSTTEKKFSLTNEVLSWEGASVSYKRKEGDPGSDLYGSWMPTVGGGSGIIFNRDGTGYDQTILEPSNFTWYITDNNILVKQYVYAYQWDYSVTGNLLTLFGANSSTYYTRVGS